MRIVSSTNSGLPSVFSSSARRTSGSKPRPARPAAPRRAARSPSGRAPRARSRSHGRARRPSRDGRRAAPARARQRMRSGARTQSARCSISSSSGSSAQWMSSKPSTTRLGLGELLDERPRRPGDLLRRALAVERLEDAGGEAEQVGDGLVLAGRCQLLERLLDGSSSEIPATVLTISASGQYVMPSPYGRQRPTSTVAPSSAVRRTPARAGSCRRRPRRRS